MWYKFEGGKKKINKAKNDRKIYLKSHEGLEKFLEDIINDNFKEILKGEHTDEDILAEVKEVFGIDMPKKYIYER